MSVKSRKVSTTVSKQELYYISRNLFKRNKSFMDDTDDKEYIFTSPKKRNQSIILKNRPFTTNSCSPIKPKYMREMEQKNQENFQRFFNTSANRVNQQCEDEFVKSRERFLYSRERSTTANTSFNLSQGFQQSPMKLQHQLSGFQDYSSPSAAILNKSISKLSQQHIHLPEEQQAMMNSLQYSQSANNSHIFMNGYNPASNKVFSATKNSFIDDRRGGASQVDQQILQEQGLIQIQQAMAQIEQQNANEQWKNVRHCAPRYTFYKNSPRKTIIGPPSASLLDDENRYNNFSIKKPDMNHTMSMRNSTGRDYKVFKQFQMNDLLYPEGNKQYEKAIFDNKTLKCQFDIQKQEQNDGVIGRQFFIKQHKNDIAHTDLDCDKVISAKNDLLPFKKNMIPKFDKISARERQSSSPYRLLKYIENPYLHEEKPQNKIRVQKCKDS